VFQHSSGTGKYCGYFRDTPRKGEGEVEVEDEEKKGMEIANCQNDLPHAVADDSTSTVTAAAAAAITVARVHSMVEFEGHSLACEGAQV
jgi:hypothetical protein